MVSTRKSVSPGSALLSLPMSTPSSAKPKARPAKITTQPKLDRKKMSQLVGWKPKRKAKKPQYTYDSEDDFEDEDESDAEVGYVSQDSEIEIVEEDIFTTFTSDKDLGAGLCVIRNLGGGKYEIVNLNDVPRVFLGAEQSTEIVKERRDMFNIPAEQWVDAKFKASLAVQNAGKQIESSQIGG